MKKRYFLFLSYPNGFMHNHLYSSLEDIADELAVIANEEKLAEKVPPTNELQKHFSKEDFYFGTFSTNFWYHIQEKPLKS
jgi:hypothetical protein